ncbi:pantoate--beta-alanine ligase [Brevibacillus agri]|uniref:Pantothenate synthetase n=1 Tax=Brevibacillus agri TaxID=51101 RepID=A0A3M8AQC1_9BACL|nr:MULTISPECIES: pantoate--beta-alanine ligase [Brevibacillus]ELK41627.1 pantoate--beta-alanine ligase [Brevibacillus agri BAB-2500]EJL40882.1 pantoate--beta-alanine ligase [Brevibacillus sp. CF112]MCG5250052.1 pantoate--beta-alanine ligase [Brevibacillus agri]MDN4091376.1 pantoate--beta-alanine ligase [Brevibacillus agri]MED1644779.1 pantoate--beta-alanine ligase [Brevibacillus agri]
MIQTMQQISTIEELRVQIKAARLQGKTIGFVPTMGFLHEGHLSLVKAAREKCDLVVMSIFVNPLQFGPNEDFERYPRDIERDSQMAAGAGVDLLFTPSVEEMYPRPILTTVSVANVTTPLCGASRPGHFDGVSTVVLKLFSIVQPDYAFFGQKDAQQVAVVTQMVNDLSVPVEVIPCPIVREADGLAMSSRNVYLSAEEREQALVLSQSLRQAAAWLEEGLPLEQIKARIRQMIADKPLAEIDYVEILRYPDLQPVETELPGQAIIVALAVRFGKTRLIDNLIAAIR